ncbi:MAG: hypothetical protein K6F23_15240 [Solobacterium sp.]|nr:hypothetical protein [Solobacterium sp.]
MKLTKEQLNHIPETMIITLTRQTAIQHGPDENIDLNTVNMKSGSVSYNFAE